MVFSVWHHTTSSMARLKIYAWHGELPCLEKGFATPRNCHAWQSQPLPCAANIKKQCHMQSLVMRKHTILTVLKLIYAVLLTNNLCFTGMADAPTNCASYMDWFSAAVNSNFCCLQLQYTTIMILHVISSWLYRNS